MDPESMSGLSLFSKNIAKLILLKHFYFASFYFFCWFEIRSHYAALDILDISIDQAGLELKRSTCLCLLSAEIKGVLCYTQIKLF